MYCATYKWTRAVNYCRAVMYRDIRQCKFLETGKWSRHRLMYCVCLWRWVLLSRPRKVRDTYPGRHNNCPARIFSLQQMSRNLLESTQYNPGCRVHPALLCACYRPFLLDTYEPGLHLNC